MLYMHNDIDMYSTTRSKDAEKNYEKCADDKGDKHSVKRPGGSNRIAHRRPADCAAEVPESREISYTAGGQKAF